MAKKVAGQQAAGPGPVNVALQGLWDWWHALDPKGGARILRTSEMTDLRATLARAHDALTSGAR